MYMRKENHPPLLPPLSIVMYPNTARNPPFIRRSCPDILLFLDVRVMLDNDRSSFLGLALFSDSPSYTYVSHYETYANLFTHGLS